MATKAKAAAAAAQPVNERLALATALSSIATKGDAWEKALHDFAELRKTTLANLENELQTFKRQRQEAEEEFEHAKRAKRIDVQQELSEFGYASALKFLTERKEVAIAADELDKLKSRLQSLEASYASEIKKAVDDERAAASRTLASEKRMLQLEHEKSIASLTSQVEALNRQLASAREEIANAERRLEAQRELCKSIAEACKTPSVVQNMGGGRMQ